MAVLFSSSLLYSMEILPEPVSIPTEDHLALADVLNIKDTENVLDIGGGHSPFSYADVIVDIDFEIGMHRDGQGMAPPKVGQQFVRADAAALPFKDKSFDVVLCVHVLEHVSDPELVCRELMRVARRGFIETPRKWTEYYGGHPSHRWLVDNIHGVLTFEPIFYDNSPFNNFALPLVWADYGLQEKVLISHRNIPCTQYLWEEAFSFKVLGEVPSLDEKRQARRYYNFAINLLNGMAPPEKVVFHAQIASTLDPDNQLYRNFYAFILALLGQIKEARRQGACVSLLLKAVMYRRHWNVYHKSKVKLQNMLTLLSARFERNG